MAGIETSDRALPFRAALYHVSLEVAALNEITSAWLEILNAPLKLHGCSGTMILFFCSHFFTPSLLLFNLFLIDF